MGDRRSFWAWCMESEEPTDADRAALAAQLSERYGTAITARPVPRAEDAQLREPRISVPDQLSAWCDDVDVRAGLPCVRRELHRPHPGVQPAVPESSRRRRPSPRRAGARDHARVVRSQRLRRHPLRRRLVGGVGREPARRLRPVRDDRPRPARSCPRDRRGVARRPHPGRRARSSPRTAVETERPHVAPFPAVIPIQLAGRMDRHPFRWALRDQPHAHRRLRRVDSDVDAAGVVGEPPAARQRRRTESRPDGDRLGRHPRRRHRGMDADPEAARVPCHRRDHVRFVAGGLRCGADDRAGQAVAGQPPHPRPGRGWVAPQGSTGPRRW